jgi:hypothetical protein
MLQRETVIWKRGLLVMPQIVRDLLDAMEVGGGPSSPRSPRSKASTTRHESRPLCCQSHWLEAVANIAAGACQLPLMLLQASLGCIQEKGLPKSHQCRANWQTARLHAGSRRADVCACMKLGGCVRCGCLVRCCRTGWRRWS